MFHAPRISIASVFMLAVLGTSSSNLFAQNRPARPDRNGIIKALKESDKNNDGKITKAELPERLQRHFNRMDTNSDGVIDKKEVAALEERFGGDKGKPAENSRTDKQRPEQGLGVAAGKPAPDFTLKAIDGKSEVKLSSFQGKRPVALIFGSYT